MDDCSDRGLKSRLVLPFAVSAEDRVKVFSKDMEMAAVVYLAEWGRQKGEGYILRKPDEKLVFVAEGYYPVWLVPWRGGTFLFDGLGVSAHTLAYSVVPDVKAFNKDIQGSARTGEAYSAVFAKDTDYFKDFIGSGEKIIEGLIASPDFVRDFSTYLSYAVETEKPLSRKAVLSHIVNEPEIAASLAELSDLRANIHDDVKSIEAGMRLLGMTTGERVRNARDEIRGIRNEFYRQVENAKPRVRRRIHLIQERYGRRITEISNRFERQLRRAHKDRVRFERMQRHLRVEINRCETRIKSCRHRKKRRSEIRWTLRLEKIRKRLPTVKNSARDADKKIRKLEGSRDLEVSQQRTECDVHVEEARKLLRDLEASREAEVRIKRQEIALMQESTSLVLSQMKEMVKSKRASMSEFERIGMPNRKRACALVYLPFYLARYEADAKNRYVVFPPSVVSGMGMLTKMKGALGVAKMKVLLQPRSKAIALFLNQIVTLIHKNPMFEKEVIDAGIQDSVLGIKKLRICVKRGLKELKDEEWLSKSEVQALSRLLYIYA